jgi:hypothetical protein
MVASMTAVAAMLSSAAMFGVLAGVVAAACTVPYVRDTLRGETVPHRGSWLIWGVLEVVALQAQRADGASWSLVPLMIQALGTCLVLTLSFWFGTGGLGPADLALLALAGLGIVGWLVIQKPVVATASAIAADLIAAVMMAPKAWRDPHSETLSTFVLASVSGVLMVGSVGSVGSLSVSLLMYPVYFAVVNAALAGVIVHGRAAGSHPVVGLRRRPTLLRPGSLDLRWAADVGPVPEAAASWYQITNQEEA